jgi:hypothetical protein
VPFTASVSTFASGIPIRGFRSSTARRRRV